MNELHSRLRLQNVPKTERAHRRSEDVEDEILEDGPVRMEGIEGCKRLLSLTATVLMNPGAEAERTTYFFLRPILFFFKI